jgi:hypothetical protein
MSILNEFEYNDYIIVIVFIVSVCFTTTTTAAATATADDERNHLKRSLLYFNLLFSNLYSI